MFRPASQKTIHPSNSIPEDQVRFCASASPEDPVDCTRPPEDTPSPLMYSEAIKRAKTSSDDEDTDTPAMKIINEDLEHDRSSGTRTTHNREEKKEERASWTSGWGGNEGVHVSTDETLGIESKLQDAVPVVGLQTLCSRRNRVTNYLVIDISIANGYKTHQALPVARSRDRYQDVGQDTACSSPIEHPEEHGIENTRPSSHGTNQPAEDGPGFDSTLNRVKVGESEGEDAPRPADQKVLCRRSNSGSSASSSPKEAGFTSTSDSEEEVITSRAQRLDMHTDMDSRSDGNGLGDMTVFSGGEEDDRKEMSGTLAGSESGSLLSLEFAAEYERENESGSDDEDRDGDQSFDSGPYDREPESPLSDSDFDFVVVEEGDVEDEYSGFGDDGKTRTGYGDDIGGRKGDGCLDGMVWQSVCGGEGDVWCVRRC